MLRRLSACRVLATRHARSRALRGSLAAGSRGYYLMGSAAGDASERSTISSITMSGLRRSTSAGLICADDTKVERAKFSANIGKWQLKGVDLITFNPSGEMIEFEVMIRPIKALQALGEAMGNRIGPQLAALKQAGAPARG